MLPFYVYQIVKEAEDFWCVTYLGRHVVLHQLQLQLQQLQGMQPRPVQMTDLLEEVIPASNYSVGLIDSSDQALVNAYSDQPHISLLLFSARRGSPSFE